MGKVRLRKFLGRALRLGLAIGPSAAFCNIARFVTLGVFNWAFCCIGRFVTLGVLLLEILYPLPKKYKKAIYLVCKTNGEGVTNCYIISIAVCISVTFFKFLCKTKDQGVTTDTLKSQSSVNGKSR